MNLLSVERRKSIVWRMTAVRIFSWRAIILPKPDSATCSRAFALSLTSPLRDLVQMHLLRRAIDKSFSTASCHAVADIANYEVSAASPSFNLARWRWHRSPSCWRKWIGRRSTRGDPSAPIYVHRRICRNTAGRAPDAGLGTAPIQTRPGARKARTSVISVVQDGTFFVDEAGSTFDHVGDATAARARNSSLMHWPAPLAHGSGLDIGYARLSLAQSSCERRCKTAAHASSPMPSEEK